MEEIYQITSALKHLSWGKEVAVITDARFSGVSTGACIGHVSPEALAGGPIGKLRHGDTVRIIVDRNRLEGSVDLIEAVENGLTERILAILAEEPDQLNRPFSDYLLYPLYAEGWYTPLVFAVVQGRVESVRILLDQGADAAVRSPDGRTLYELAKEKGHQQIAALLKAAQS